jgi:hypothetical protein
MRVILVDYAADLISSLLLSSEMAAAAAASSSSSASAAAGSSLSWSTLIPTPRAATTADIDALEARFGVSLPARLRSLLVEEGRGGQQPTPSAFLAQNVHTAAWKREQVGPFYPAVAPEGAAGADEDENEEGEEMYPHLSLVNSSFLDELLQQDDDVAEPAVSRKKARQSPAAAKEALNAAERQKAAAKQARVPFFAFAETPSGLLLVLDTRSQCVMLLDVTGRKGPWVVAENFDDFFARITEGGAGKSKKASAGEADDQSAQMEQEVEEEEEDAEGGADAYGDDDDDEEEGDMFCCDACMDELPASSAVRFHCDQCENYDLCVRCKTDADKKAAQAGGASAAAAAAAASAGSSKGVKRSVQGQAHAHPSSHTFTRIEPSSAGAHEEDDEEEEEEKESDKKKKKGGK